MAEKKNIATGYIGNALRSSAADHTTTFTDEVFDTERQKYQSEVNTDIEERIEAEKNRAEAAEEAIIYDISARNNGVVFESLSALLNSSDLSTLIPASVRHGGMTIRFIQGSEQSSDNKYMQYHYMKMDVASSATFTDTSNWQGVDDAPTAGSENLVKSGGVQSALAPIKSQIVNFKNSLQDLNGENLYVTDGKGYVVAKINSDGIEAIEVKVGDKKLSEQLTQGGIADIIPEFYPSELYITDGKGNVAAYIDSDGIHSINILVESLPVNLWAGKNVATYGDSITAINNGDFVKPYNQNALSAKWGNKVAKYFDFNKQNGRGIGSTCFMWRPSGGQVAWVKTATGLYENRNDSYTYDNYEGHVTIPTDCTPIRGDGCSWLRITSMFPAAIKDNIDAVLVMFHNDFHQDMDTDVIWQPNDTTDPEWAASTYYSTFNGDYNITTVKGGIASTVMKLQVWMPQARIVLMTPISGVYATAEGLDGNFDNTESAKMKKLAECVKDVSFRMSIPCIDNYGNDGINSLNRTSYISDNIHPYTDAGCKRVAMSVIGGLNGIIPSINY